MKTAWPTATDVTTRLTGLGVSIPAGYSAADAIAAAIIAWESATGVSPWLASATASTRRFDAAQSGYLPIVAAEVALVEAEFNGVSGSALTLNQDYWVVPAHAPATFRPIRTIEFAARRRALPQSIRVTAKWGFQLQIFEDVWLAVLDHAVAALVEAASMRAGLAAGGSGAITSLKQADVSITYQDSSSFAAKRRVAWQATVNKYADKAVV